MQMHKPIEINYIEDNDLARMNMLTEYSVGTWVLCTTNNHEYLCVIAQVDMSKIALIAFDEADPTRNNSHPDANRMGTPFPVKGALSQLNNDDIYLLTNGGKWRLTKVNVDINVYVNEPEEGPTPFTEVLQGGKKRKTKAPDWEL